MILPANAQGFARGGPQSLPDPSGYLGQANTHYLTGYNSGMGLVVYDVVDQTSGAIESLGVAAVANNPSGKISILATDTEGIVMGAGAIGNVTVNYVVAGLLGTGTVDKITNIYIDDQYAPGGYPNAPLQNAVDWVRGIFIESLDEARARKVYAIHIAQAATAFGAPPGGLGSPVGATRWGFVHTGNAPSFFGGPIEIVNGALAEDISPEPPAMVAGNALEIGQWNLGTPILRNLTIADTGKLTTKSDVIATDSTKGVVLKSPNGHYWRITVGNTGTLTSTDLGTVAP